MKALPLLVQYEVPADPWAHEASSTDHAMPCGRMARTQWRLHYKSAGYPTLPKKCGTEILKNIEAKKNYVSLPRN